MRRRIGSLIAATALVLVGVQAVSAAPGDAPAPTEDGYTASLVSALPGPASGIAVGPDGLLYVSVIDQGEILSVTTGGPPPRPAGGIYRLRPLPTGQAVPEPVVTGRRLPLGLTFGPDGDLYFTDLVHGQLFNESFSAVFGADVVDAVGPVEPRKLLSGLPNGVHQTNQVAFGPDGLLYVANGSTTDSGVAGPYAPLPPLTNFITPQEQFPLSGSILRFDPDDAADAPLSATRYQRPGGEFGYDPVDVVATGMRNNFGLEFVGDDLYVTFNGPNPMHYDDTVGDDLLLRVTDAPSRSYANGTMVDFGWPGCLWSAGEDGWPVPYTPEVKPDWAKPCGDASTTPPLASMGRHASADGLAVAPTEFGEHAGDLFVALFGSPAQVARVELAPDGTVAAGPDGRPAATPFVTGGSFIDVVFHEGAMYVARFADGNVAGGFGTIWRVAPGAGGGGGGGGEEPPALPELPELPLPDGPGGPAGETARIVAGPGAATAGYLLRTAVVPTGGTASLTNLDSTVMHNVVAKDKGPDNKPLFRSAFASGTQTVPIAGVENLAAGSYAFVCSIHESTMTGTLQVVGA